MTIGKFISCLKVSVSTMPDNGKNLSSPLFKIGTNKQEYPGGVFIIHGFKILWYGKFLFCSL